MSTVTARLARDGESVLCGWMRPERGSREPALATYYGKDGSDPGSFRIELAHHLTPVAGGGSPPRFALAQWRQNDRDNRDPLERPRVTRHPEGFHFEGGVNIPLQETVHGPLRTWEVRFPSQPVVVIRCQSCGTDNTVEGADLAEQYRLLVGEGRLRRR